ncbi:YicC/YloC family endoribonuclease [Palleronia rufa]
MFPSVTRSMTGFASHTGAWDDWSWTWELRSVNGKGLDLRLRLPDWIGGLEAALRARFQGAVSRGNVGLSLKLMREAGAGGFDRAALDRALAQIAAVEDIARAAGRPLAPVRATDLLTLRTGAEILDADAEAALRDRLIADFDTDVLPAFLEVRAAEGRALDAILTARLDEIASLVALAGGAARSRQAVQAQSLDAAVRRILDETAATDPDRLAQELALIAVRQDVTEELDRLGAHVDAARTLVRRDAPKGRKLDFLMQEFMREANTLCAKSQDTALTAHGLDLKTVIDQLREQVQNVE